MKHKTYIVGALAALVLVGSLATPSAVRAQVSGDVTALLAQIQQLTQMVTQLQEQLRTMRGEVQDLREELKAGLREGMTDEDIRKIQEVLASDPTVYPEGLTTGYFGPLTREALKRFQRNFELAETGEVDEETRAALEALLAERMNGQVPAGLLRAPGIEKKIQDRILDRVCKNTNNGVANAVRCADYERDRDRDRDRDGDDDEDGLEIEVEVENGTAKVEIEFADDADEDDLSFEVDFTTEAAVIAEIVDRTDLTESEVEAVIEFEYEDEDDEDDDEEEDEEDEDDEDDDDDDN